MEIHPVAENAAPPSRKIAPLSPGGTMADRQDMAKLGHEQKTERIFKPSTMTMFTCAIIATPQVIITSSHLVAASVGTGGLFWGYILVAAVFSIIYASIAEMASIFPTAGGQYTWISIFAPKGCERYLSFLVGWLNSIGWASGIVSIASLLNFCIQGLITLHDPEYTPENWHSTLFIIAILIFAIFFNICFARWLPFFEAAMALVSIGGILIVCLVLWIMLPTNNPHDAFMQFKNNTGWNSTGMALMTRLLYLILSVLGFDCTVHMSEETQNASKSTPKAIMIGYATCVGLGLIAVVTLIFTWGNALDMESDVPFIHLIQMATQNSAATTVLVSLIDIPLLGSVVACTATASRQVWALARDHGVPCSDSISHIPSRFKIPLMAIVVQFGVCTVLSLINLGSPEAFNAILSLNQGVILGSYMLAIGCKINARVRGDLPQSPWSLGRFGLCVDVLAVLLLASVFVFAMFPSSASVDPDIMNWGVLLLGSVIILCTVDFFFRGRHHYISPKQHKEGVEEIAAR